MYYSFGLFLTRKKATQTFQGCLILGGFNAFADFFITKFQKTIVWRSDSLKATEHAVSLIGFFSFSSSTIQSIRDVILLKI